MSSEHQVSVRSVFVSSPGDLQDERDAAARVIEDIGQESLIADHFSLRCYRYEDRTPPVVGGDEPQEVVDYFTARASEVDILICILGDTLGTPLVDTKSIPGERLRYASGTAYELQQALGVPPEKRPQILLYRRQQQSGSDARSRKEVDDYLTWLFRQVPSSKRAELEEQFGHTAQVYHGLYEHAEFATPHELYRRLTRDLHQILAKEKQKASTFGVTDHAGSIDEVTLARRTIAGIWHEYSAGLDTIPTRIELDPSNTENNTVLSHADARELARQLPRVKKVFLSGQPDSGKSFVIEHALLESSRVASTDGFQQVSVVINLSSWRSDLAFETWIIRELDRFYGIQARLSRRLIRGNQFLFLFDGLDEVGRLAMADRQEEEAADLQVRCLQAIRQFLDHVYNEDYRFVITSRSQTLRAVAEQLNLAELFEGLRVARIRPLEQDQIEAYLNVPLNFDLAPLLERIRNDPVFSELARTPYMLSSLVKVYRPDASGYIDWGGRRDVAGRVAHVVAKIQNRRFSELNLDPETISMFQSVMGWVSQRVVRTHLMVELLGPQDLRSEHRTEYRLLASLLLALAVGMISAVSLGTNSLVEWTVLGGEADEGPNVLRGGKHFAITSLSALCLAIATAWPVFAFCKRVWFGACLAGIFALMRGLMVLVTPEYPGGSPPTGVGPAISTTVVTFLLILIPFSMFGRREDFDVMKIEPLSSFSWKYSRARTPVAVFVVVAIGFLVFFSAARAITFGVFGAAILGTYFAMARTGIHVPPQPNWGIIRSFKTARNTSLVLTATAVIVIPLGYYFDEEFQRSLLVALDNMALSLAVLFSFLIFGGIPFLQHVSMRIILSRRRYAPMDLIRFLNLAVQVGPLRRVGGAYSFRADLVQNHYRQRVSQSFD
ncbi:MAG: NACHT domain-containing protein [Planctomycetota bacterium]